MDDSNQVARSNYELIYLILAAIFITALVTCNLVFQKFFVWDLSFLGLDYQYELSVGILAYPVTFLVTDILSEIYGKARANRVVTSGLVASIFVMGLLFVSDTVVATSWSPVDDKTFHRVFGLSWIAITASMVAYLGAQYLDIRLFHFWKRLTRGRHLWLRNNASTVTSQVLDTVLIMGLLTALGATGMDAADAWERFPGLVMNGVTFKWIVAILDTPIFYLAVWFLSRYCQLTPASAVVTVQE